jgi:enoyl-CoA hydratase/carnithine racemase
MVSYEHIRYEVDDPVATITLDRPTALNGWTGRMAAEVRHAVACAEADRAVVGIVITGAGRAFCAGADMNDLATLTEGGALESSWAELEVAPDADLPDDFTGTYTYLLATKKPVIAAINGAIAGMAVPIALCCDVRFMAEDAPFLTAFARRGLIAEYGVSWLLARVAGTATAIDLLLSSRRITGAEAARLGVVHAALPADEVLPHARKYVEEIAATCSPRSIAIMKRQISAQIHAGLGPAEYESRRLMIESFGRPDFREGVSSFREKRPPNFERLGDG